MPSAHGQFAFRRALQVETATLEGYKRTLTVFTDLTVHGQMPEE